MIRKELPDLIEKNVRVLVMGDIELLPKKAKSDLHKMIEKTSQNTGISLCLAISYGGRNEIVRAARQFAFDCINNKTSCNDLTAEKFGDYMYLPEVPYPELIIRTGGDKRISNFLLWQSAYSEFYWTDTLWPDFNEEEFIEAFKQFSKIERRFGKVDDDD
jgi:undecaprenyl diphosphate synthase